MKPRWKSDRVRSHMHCLSAGVLKALLVSASVATPAHAQSPPGNDLRTALEERVDVEEWSGTHLNDTPDGPAGRFTLRGSLSDPNSDGAAEAESIAKQAIRGLPELIALPPDSSLQVDKYRVRPRGVRVRLGLEVNGVPVEHLSLDVDVDQDGVVTRVDGRLVPVSRSMVSASTTPTLPRPEFVALIVEDLRATPGGDPLTPLETETWLTAEFPYLVTRVVSGSHVYRVDTQTGKILSKTSRLMR